MIAMVSAAIRIDARRTMFVMLRVVQSVGPDPYAAAWALAAPRGNEAAAALDAQPQPFAVELLDPVTELKGRPCQREQDPKNDDPPKRDEEAVRMDAECAG